MSSLEKEQNKKNKNGVQEDTKKILSPVRIGDTLYLLFYSRFYLHCEKYAEKNSKTTFKFLQSLGSSRIIAINKFDIYRSCVCFGRKVYVRSEHQMPSKCSTSMQTFGITS